MTMKDSSCWYLLVFLHFAFHSKDAEGFFIKHSSGNCLVPNVTEKDGDTGSSWGYLLLIKLNADCLHQDAQFRFWNNISVIYNMEQKGCIHPEYRSSSIRYEILYVYHGYPYLSKDACTIAFKQTQAGWLQANYKAYEAPVEDRCAVPFKHSKGNLIEMTTSCNSVTDQQFRFGSVTCEGNTTQDVNCPINQVMVIRNAMYGGSSEMTTCGYNEDINCTFDATCIMKSLCNGLRNCSITVNSNLFNMDPCPQKAKYLYFEYQCIDPPLRVQNYCVSEVKLSSSIFPSEGFLEINFNSEVRKVCNDGLSNTVENIICRQLGYQESNERKSILSTPKNRESIFFRVIYCDGEESSLSQCEVEKLESGKTCPELSYISCFICSEQLLVDSSKFPDSSFIVSPSGSQTASKARISSNSSLCFTLNANNFLDINLGMLFVVSSVITFGDSTTPNWVTSYKLNYTRDLTEWEEAVYNQTKIIPGNNDAYNNAAIRNLDMNITVLVLRFIPLAWYGEPCVRLEICGHALLPASPTNVHITNVSSTTVKISWNAPGDHGDGPILKYSLILTKDDYSYFVRKFNVSSDKNSSLIIDLVPYTNYSLAIAAGNRHGFGNVAKTGFTTAEAAPDGPPRNISVTAKNASSLFITWKKPEASKQNGIIRNYTVCISPIDIDTNDCPDEYVAAEKSLLITNLNSSTKYYVKVLASTGVGSGNYSNSQEGITNGEPLTARASETNSTTIVLALQRPNGNFSHFFIVAIKLSDDELPNKSPDEYDTKVLRKYSDAQSSSAQVPYIAAVVSVTDNFKELFVLGDGIKTTNSGQRKRRSMGSEYYNGPLEAEKYYSVFQRFYDKEDYYSTYWSSPVKTAPKPETPTTVAPQDETTNGNKTGIIIAVCVVVPVLFVVVLLVIILRRRRRDKKSQFVDKKVELAVSNEAFEPAIDIPDGENIADNNADDIAAEVDDLVVERGDENKPPWPPADDERLYSNQSEIDEQKKHEDIPICQFNAHVVNMKKDGRAGFKKEFEGLPVGKHFSWDVSKRSFNKDKNRYGNIVTYDHSRVVLSGDEKADYINASHIDGITKEYYIAGQGPNKMTVNDFWRMIYEYKCSTIVMVTTLVEMGKVKCEEYWPSGSGMYGEINVTTKETKTFADHVTRIFILEKGGGTHEIKQFHFLAWPDHGVPQYPTQILTFRRHYKAYHETKSGPVVVHCSAGVGRTGVFIAIDKIIDEVEKKDVDTLNVFNLVKHLRTRRINMVQTLDQYIFIHEAVLDHVRCGNNEIDAANIGIEIKKMLQKNSLGESGFQEKFKCLNEVSPSLTDDGCDAALLPNNKRKNRVPNIYPSEVSRVYLDHVEDVEDSDYINACFVDGYLGRNFFIATQAPLPETINDFWRMFFQHKSSTMVMLNQLREEHEEYPMFWPTERAKPCTYGSTTLMLDSVKKNVNIITRKFIISATPDIREGRPMRMVHYIGWPDHGVPKDPEEILTLLSEVEESQRAGQQGPVTVVCSDGAGRTGTYITISNVVDRMKVVHVVDVFQAIKLIRSSRPQFVENEVQFQFCYSVVKALLKSFSGYSNFGIQEES